MALTCTKIASLGYKQGTYKANGKKITTYVEGEEYIVFNVSNVTSSSANYMFYLGDEWLFISTIKE